ncbi:MAG: 3-isopropylmalate dehydratase small subunit [Clostridia bacterium]|jgi:3-isopropylmalate/(R)-2-methylmalate dehydratase small subunit|nr:3-isopropylmalate dehydratase small subunit [Clostridiaceae bacterium]
MMIQGRVFKYGDHVDTDVIIPARYLNTTDPAELAKHCMEDIDKTFVDRVKEGDIMVAGINFGCGSSREHAPIAIKASGIRCVIAKSFARIFFRNAINTGLTIMECEEAAEEIKEGDEVKVDPTKGTITNVTTGKTYKAQPFPDFLQEIISAGGLLNTLDI